MRSPTQGARSRIRSKGAKIANRCPALPDPRVFASGFPAASGSVKQRLSKRLRVAEQFPVAEHPGSKHDEGGRPLCREPGGRSCRSFHPVPIFSSPGRRALPRCTRCFFRFVLFLNLDLTSGFDMACSFESCIESSPIFGRGLRKDFFTGSGLPFCLRPKSFMNKAKPFGRYLRASFVEVEVMNELRVEHSTTARLQPEAPRRGAENGNSCEELDAMKRILRIILLATCLASLTTSVRAQLER